MGDDLYGNWVGRELLPGPAVGSGSALLNDGLDAELGVEQALEVGVGSPVEV